MLEEKKRSELLQKRDKFLNNWFNNLDTLTKDGIYNSDVDMTELRELDGMEYEQYLDGLEENSNIRIRRVLNEHHL